VRLDTREEFVLEEDKERTAGRCPVITQVGNKYKDSWDALIGIILMITCTLTPINIAFSYSEGVTSDIPDHIMDVLFLIDLILCFNTEFVTEEFETIRDRK